MEEKDLEKQESDISMHVFSVSATLVGVCLTVIGILNAMGKGKSVIDEMTAVNALIFLASCILSYYAMKTGDNKRRFLLESRVDFLFIFGLLLMFLICVFIAFDFIK